MEKENADATNDVLFSLCMILSSFLATVKTKNSDEWMLMAADAINKTMLAVGDSDRVRYDRPRGELIIIRSTRGH